MNTSDEESVHKSGIWPYENSESSVSKNKPVLQDTELRKEVSDMAFNLEKENSVLRLKLEVFGKGSSKEDSKGREKVEFLQDLVEVRNRQVKELWNVIQCSMTRTCHLRVTWISLSKEKAC